jgi:hypothetical protein
VKLILGVHTYRLLEGCCRWASMKLRSFASRPIYVGAPVATGLGL